LITKGEINVKKNLKSDLEEKYRRCKVYFFGAVVVSFAVGMMIGTPEKNNSEQNNSKSNLEITSLQCTTLSGVLMISGHDLEIDSSGGFAYMDNCIFGMVGTPGTSPKTNDKEDTAAFINRMGNSAEHGHATNHDERCDEGYIPDIDGKCKREPKSINQNNIDSRGKAVADVMKRGDL
jgi:hypothetical protein